MQALSIRKDALIDVIIVTYNHAPWLQACVDSVVSQEFGGRGFNVLVWDDYSTKAITSPYGVKAQQPGMINSLRSKSASGGVFSLGGIVYGESPRNVLYRIKNSGVHTVIDRENRGTIGARIAAYDYMKSRSDSQYVLFVDGDDKLEPHFIDRLWRRINIESAVVAYPKIAIFSDIGATPHGSADQGTEFSAKRLMSANYIPATSLMQKSAFEDVGYFDKDFDFGFEDWALWLKMAETGRAIAFEKDAVLLYRHHPYARSKKANDQLWLAKTYIRNKYPGLWKQYKPVVEYIDTDE